MQEPGIPRAFVAALFCAGMILSACPADLLASTSTALPGTTRTYYVAADEMQWDYTPSGRDEAMGMEFDDVGKAFTESGPHRIGHVYKKAVYHEYTDGSFSALKPRAADEQYLGIVGPILRGAVGDTIRIVFKNNASHP